jgi:hypothetical protein
MAQHFSRQHLHELVWTEPRAALARRLGISDTGLAKACIRAGIPMPARGYWARLAAGKPVIKADLPRRGLGQSDLIQIGRPDFRALTGSEPEEVPPEPCFEEAVETVRARAQAMLLGCRVPKGLQNAHPLIAALIAEDDARRTETEKYRVSWQQPRFDSRVGQRRLRIANALFTVMAHAGATASLSSRELDRIGFRIGDTFIEVEITGPQVTRRVRKWDSEVLKDGIALTTAPWPRVTGTPTVWADIESRPLETRITEIACDLLVTGELAYRESVRKHHEWCRERRQKWEADIHEAHERTEREARERRQRQERERREWLLGQAANRRHADDIRALVRAADRRHLDSTEEAAQGVYGRWRSWALMQADQLDPCLGPLDALVGPAVEELSKPESGDRCTMSPAE